MIEKIVFSPDGTRTVFFREEKESILEAMVGELISSGSEKVVTPHDKSLIGASEVRGNSSSEKPKRKRGRPKKVPIEPLFPVEDNFKEVYNPDTDPIVGEVN